SSELNAICCARPKQSSAMNFFPADLNADIHSEAPRRYGELGFVRVVLEPPSVSVEKGKSRTFVLPRVLPAKNARADRSRGEDDRHGAERGERHPLRHAAGLLPERLRGVAEAFAFGLELAPDLGGRPTCH